MDVARRRHLEALKVVKMELVYITNLPDYFGDEKVVSLWCV